MYVADTAQNLVRQIYCAAGKLKHFEIIIFDLHFPRLQFDFWTVCRTFNKSNYFPNISSYVLSNTFTNTFAYIATHIYSYISPDR